MSPPLRAEEALELTRAAPGARLERGATYQPQPDSTADRPHRDRPPAGFRAGDFLRLWQCPPAPEPRVNAHKQGENDGRR